MDERIKQLTRYINDMAFVIKKDSGIDYFEFQGGPELE